MRTLISLILGLLIGFYAGHLVTLGNFLDWSQHQLDQALNYDRSLDIYENLKMEGKVELLLDFTKINQADSLAFSWIWRLP